VTNRERRVLRKICLFSWKRPEVRSEVLYSLAWPKVEYRSLTDILDLIDDLRDHPGSGKVGT